MPRWRAADRIGSRNVIGGSIATVAVSCLLLAGATSSLVLLVLGVIVLDIGVQAGLGFLAYVNVVQRIDAFAALLFYFGQFFFVVLAPGFSGVRSHLPLDGGPSASPWLRCRTRR